jgi:hypothetical protein
LAQRHITNSLKATSSFNLLFFNIEENIMKSIVSIAAASVLFAGSAVASPEFDNHANYGTVLQDLDQPASMSEGRAPTGDLVSVIDGYGSILFDLNQPGSRAVWTQPGIGDNADDSGNILYDVGARY